MKSVPLLGQELSRYRSKLVRFAKSEDGVSGEIIFISFIISYLCVFTEKLARTMQWIQANQKRSTHIMIIITYTVLLLAFAALELKGALEH